MSTNPTQQSPLNVSSKDKFIMLLDLPSVLKKNEPTFAAEPLKISLYGAVVPEISVPAIEARFHGQNLYVPSYSRPSYSPLSVNFVVDNNYNNYYTLWKWLDVLNLSLENKYGGNTDSSETLNIEQDLTSGYLSEYETTIRVLALNEYNQTTLEFLYTKAFISKLGGIQYSYRDGSILESNADFYFSQLTVEKN